MFSAKQIEYIKSATGKTFDFEHLSDDDLVEIEDSIAELLQKKGFDDNDEINDDGKMCESILDRLAE